MTSDPNALLAWMRARGPGDVTARVISDSGPRAFRRRSDADVAMAALIERGDIVETCTKPRTFRVSAQLAPELPDGARDLQSAHVAPIDRKSGRGSKLGQVAPVYAEGAAMPLSDEIMALYEAAIADREGLPDDAAAYIASADLKRSLMQRLGCWSAENEAIGQAVDDAVMDAFGCEIGVGQ